MNKILYFIIYLFKIPFEKTTVSLKTILKTLVTPQLWEVILLSVGIIYALENNYTKATIALITGILIGMIRIYNNGHWLGEYRKKYE